MIAYKSAFGTILFILAGCVSAPIKDQQAQGNPADIYIQLGVAHMQEGNYETAVAKLQKALAIDPEYPSAHSVLGLVYSRLGDKAQAEQHFKQALALAPNDSGVLNNYGRFLCQLGRPQEAAQMFTKAVQNPLYATPEKAHANAGLCAVRNKDFTNAEAHLREALRIDPTLPIALLGMARINYQLKRYLPARGYLERYTEVAPHTPQSLQLGIQIERELGNDNAVETYSQILKSKFPRSNESRQFMGGEENGQFAY
jgi:type IV pilus assembly protein PilF